MLPIRIQNTSLFLLALLSWLNGISWTSIPCTQAKTILAPYGGSGIVLKDFVLCSTKQLPEGWHYQRRQKILKPPRSIQANATGDTKRQVKVARNLRACQSHYKTIHLVAYSEWPKVDEARIELRLDEGRMTVDGQYLENSIIQQHYIDQDKAVHNTDTCRDPQINNTTTENPEQCAFSIPKTIKADIKSISFYFYPAGTPAQETDIESYDSDGHLLEHIPYAPSQIIIQQLFRPEVSLNIHQESPHVDFLHPDVIAAVECAQADCSFDGRSLQVKSEHSYNNRLNLSVRLTPRVFIQEQKKLSNNWQGFLPVTRCLVQIVSGSPLMNVFNQNIILRLGGECGRFYQQNLSVSISGEQYKPFVYEKQPDALYLAFHLNRVPDYESNIEVLYQRALIGLTRWQAKDFFNASIQLEIDKIGMVDFVPSNREVRLKLPSQTENRYLVPIAHPGLYSVREDKNQVYYVRTKDGASGFLTFRFALRRFDLPGALKDLNLCFLNEPVERSIKTANIPLTLQPQNSWITLKCLDDKAHLKTIQPGKIQSIPYRSRYSCRIMFDTNRLTTADGEQVLRVTTYVQSPDGAIQREVNADQTLRFRANTERQEFFIEPGSSAFDRIFVRISPVVEEWYAKNNSLKSADTSSLLVPLQWSLITGNQRFRYYITSSFPTGLFRVADAGHSGILGLNGGVLFRLAYLNQEGQPIPLGVETGVMWMGIAGDTSNSPYGQIALVAGLGLGVPITNTMRRSQATISLHAWAEYEVSRAVLRKKGRPWGFVFGPSLSIGNVGINF